jgi:5-methylcytosine-specific restriction endonuclease McrA
VIKGHFCFGCGNAFPHRRISNDANRYCSRACAFRFRYGKEIVSRRWKARFRIFMCNVCRKLTSAGVVCSASCRTKWNTLRQRTYAAAVHIVQSRSCVVCHTDFTPPYGDKRRMFCSKRCLTRATKRISKPLRRARQRRVDAESINPLKVFIRDGWRCQLCYRRLSQRHVAPHPLTPTLDHIVPLALGGAHRYSNVQAVHLKCNYRKGIRVCGSQFPLALGGGRGMQLSTAVAQ